MALADRKNRKPDLPAAPAGYEWVFNEDTFEPLLWHESGKRIDRELTAKVLEEG